jgi:hypothetical protein
MTDKDATIAKLREENEALRLDAARYRWIRDDCARAHQLDSLLLSPNPDAAIDAVRLTGQPCICGQTTVDPWCPRCTSALAAGAGDSVSVQGKETGNEMDRDREGDGMITIAQCPCGHATCGDYHLVGIGKFCQGSGFSKKEAAWIAALLNGFENTETSEQILMRYRDILNDTKAAL